MTFPIGSGPYLEHVLNVQNVRRVSTKERIAGYRARCKELGLRCDRYGLPVIADGPRRKSRRTPVTASARTFDAAISRAVTGPSTAILNRAERRREPTALPIDPTVPRVPSHDPAAAAQLEKVTALGLPSSCLACPKRRTYSDGAHALSFGYCTRGDDGGQVCEGITRKCPSCGENKEQLGWNLGFVALTPPTERVDWVCAECKFDVSAELPPRFRCTLDVTDIGKHLLISELSQQPGLAVGQICIPLARLVGALRESNDVEINLDDCDKAQRDSTAVVLSNVASRIGSLARDAAQRLYVSWVDAMWIPKEERQIPRPLSEFELSALAHGERPA